MRLYFDGEPVQSLEDIPVGEPENDNGLHFAGTTEFDPDWVAAQFLRAPRNPEFLVSYPSGYYVRFTAIPNLGSWSERADLDSTEVGINMKAVELLEVGDIYDRQGSD